MAQTTNHNETAQMTAVPSVHYDSTAYGLGIDYPNNWVVADTADKLNVTSPIVNIVTPNGQVAGHVIVTIQNQQTTIVGFPSAGATASLASDKLTYKQPTPVQRAQTYLSYLGYTGASSIDALYLTGDNGYQQGQAIPIDNVVKSNPLVSVTFGKCTTSYCSKDTPTSLMLRADGWSSAQFKTEVLDILQSLTIN
jgi:hypothetical protein